LAEAAVRHGARSQAAARCEHRRNELHLNPGRSLGTGASSTRRTRPKPRTRRRSNPVGGSRPKQRAPARAPPGIGRAIRPAEAGVHTRSPPGSCLPPASHRGGAQTQDTQRECDDISHGVRILSAYEPGRSLSRFTSPAPSALRVSHPLSGLIPPGPRGFVSRHIRP
jgi:hypothetical protein